MTPTDACATPIIDRIKRLIRDLEAGAILGYDGPQEHWSTRMGAEASSEVARLLSAALAVEAGTVGVTPQRANMAGWIASPMPKWKPPFPAPQTEDRE